MFSIKNSIYRIKVSRNIQLKFENKITGKHMRIYPAVPAANKCYRKIRRRPVQKLLLYIYYKNYVCRIEVSKTMSYLVLKTKYIVSVYLAWQGPFQLRTSVPGRYGDTYLSRDRLGGDVGVAKFEAQTL